ncbi:hypothetical protein [Xenorhabdus griffiniae]|uniref:Type 1 fimbrial protein n=1 Tax=Xenorhabdus griffiniae TaxID=351672 RepID=A0ABY9XEU2_9GAMM|nr:hypothetical protein [Xenorhabdus griffiniae]MBD1225994.1 hypothetical protein [Xenorhabdus griffiniae]MBE8585888.1 hypothetical protein [Xenorhabdus griffiniae]WMV71432.1 hypothetical protein QL128_14825 [Xenorhabdus griffiniae]WNH01109.1 hypothetical protein QL112_014830 [Xenorhabdus griffiniae]
MKTRLFKLAAFKAALISSLLVNSVLANSGTVQFSGEIVSPPCVVHTKDEKAEVRCFIENKETIKAVNPQTLKGVLKTNQSNISVNRLSKNVAILIITHH